MAAASSSVVPPTVAAAALGPNTSHGSLGCQVVAWYRRALTQLEVDPTGTVVDARSGGSNEVGGSSGLRSASDVAHVPSVIVSFFGTDAAAGTSSSPPAATATDVRTIPSRTVRR